MLNKFKEVVTIPPEPCLLQISNSKSIVEKERKEDQRRKIDQKIKLKKNKMTAKIAQEILAMKQGTQDNEMSVDKLTLQQLDAHNKPLSSSTLEKIRELTAPIERERKKEEEEEDVIYDQEEEKD